MSTTSYKRLSTTGKRPTPVPLHVVDERLYEEVDISSPDYLLVTLLMGYCSSDFSCAVSGAHEPQLVPPATMQGALLRKKQVIVKQSALTPLVEVVITKHLWEPAPCICMQKDQQVIPVLCLNDLTP